MCAGTIRVRSIGTDLQCVLAILHRNNKRVNVLGPIGQEVGALFIMAY
jgi:hypothetical protein